MTERTENDQVPDRDQTIQLKLRVSADLVDVLDELALKSGASRSAVGALAVLFGVQALEKTLHPEVEVEKMTDVRDRVWSAGHAIPKPTEVGQKLFQYPDGSYVVLPPGLEGEALIKALIPSTSDPEAVMEYLNPTPPVPKEDPIPPDLQASIDRAYAGHVNRLKHLHRPKSQKREDAVRTWFDKGTEMGEFTCECGESLTRQIR